MNSGTSTGNILRRFGVDSWSIAFYFGHDQIPTPYLKYSLYRYQIHSQSQTELPFLDLLAKKVGTSIETDVYHKPTGSKQY